VVAGEPRTLVSEGLPEGMQVALGVVGAEGVVVVDDAKVDLLDVAAALHDGRAEEVRNDRRGVPVCPAAECG
jgi:hypothetical protein